MPGNTSKIKVMKKVFLLLLMMREKNGVKQFTQRILIDNKLGDLIKIAIKDKTGCPFSFFRMMTGL